MTRQLAGAEHLIAPGRPRSTRVALLFSLSSDLWQPFGYVSMAERGVTYFSLVHDQYLVDLLTERDVEAGRLREYDVLYVTDPCVSKAACDSIRRWVETGGWLYGSGAAASRNEFNEAHPGLSVLLTRVGYRSLHALLPLLRACPNLHLDTSYFATHLGIEAVADGATAIPFTSPP